MHNASMLNNISPVECTQRSISPLPLFNRIKRNPIIDKEEHHLVKDLEAQKTERA